MGMEIWGMDGAVYDPAYDNATACHIVILSIKHLIVLMPTLGGGHTAVIAPSRGVMESGPVP